MVDLLEKLSNENGVSGNEDKIRQIIIDEVTPYADDISVDSIGNIIVHKSGTGKKILVTAHMDEPGFILSGITDKGYIKFKSVGSMDSRTIISKRVSIGDNKIMGVIGMKAIHLQKRAERENTVDVSDLFIDIGAKDKAHAEKKVKLGDYITFDTSFGALNENVKGKALDSRIGCFCLIEALKKNYKNDIHAVFATQHEVGSRGAKVAAYNINADIALVLDTVESADMFKTADFEKNAKVGHGAVISYMDKRIIADKAASDKLLQMAEKANIKTQMKMSTVGATDGGAVQTSGLAAKTISIGVPCRYSHTPVSIASKADIKAALKLTELFLENGDEI
jgi:endoglucanase